MIRFTPGPIDQRYNGTRHFLFWSAAELPPVTDATSARGHFTGVGDSYRAMRHLAVAFAALWAVLADRPASTSELTLRLIAALVVIVIDVAPIGDAPLAQRRHLIDPLLGMASLVVLGLVNPAALVPVAVALTAGYLCFLGPTWMHAPAAAVQLGGTVLIGAFSNRPAQLLLLLPVMVLTDVSKALGAHLIDDSLRNVDQRFDVMVENNQALASTLTTRLQHQRAHDDLTGIPNRAQVGAYLVDAAKEQATFALLVLDLTQFWRVNDALGHRAGDQLLTAVSQRLTSALADDVGIIGRTGGDEFALVSLPIGGEDEAFELAYRILGVLERPFESDGILVQLSANVGIALYPAHAEGAGTLGRAADLAMHRAKRAGQPVKLYRPVRHGSSLRQVTLLGELGRAMKTGELTLHYQPALDLVSGRTVQVEALLRWQHPDRGLLLPGDFIETVEASHMIHPLTRWVVARALRDTQAMREAGLDLGVAVNVSVKNLQDPDLADFFDLLSHRDDFHAERLQLEITETELIEDSDRVIDVLARLRSLGLSIAVDDFGVGHTSLAYLKHLPASHLKIDRSFVQSITADSHDAAIVHSTIELAHRLGLTVTAEGTADLATLLMLADMGCDVAQGFFLSEAVPLKELVTMVEHLDAWAPELLGNSWHIKAHPSYPSTPDAISLAQR